MRRKSAGQKKDGVISWPHRLLIIIQKATLPMPPEEDTSLQLFSTAKFNLFLAAAVAALQKKGVLPDSFVLRMQPHARRIFLRALEKHIARLFSDASTIATNVRSSVHLQIMDMKVAQSRGAKGDLCDFLAGLGEVGANNIMENEDAFDIISDHQIREIGKIHDVSYLRSEVKKYVRTALRRFVTVVLEEVVVATRKAARNVILEDDIRFALEHLGRPFI